MKIILFAFTLIVLQSSLLLAKVVSGKAHIVDGDTIVINGIKIRLYGIDAPEAGQKCKKVNGGSWPCGNEAIKVIVGLTEGNQVSCRGDFYDDFGRLIATCTSNKTEINKELVSLGLAWNFDKYSMHYKEIEKEARRKSVGVFQATTITPWEYRAKRWEVAKQIAPAGCPIKGNIGNNGRIYHPPWSPWYNKTKVTLSKGERWFCSEAEALAAGWKAPNWK